MSRVAVTGGTRTRWHGFLARGVDGGRAVAHGLVFCALAAIGRVPLAGLAMIFLYVIRGAGELMGFPGGPDPDKLGLVPALVLIAAVPASRWLAQLTRSLAGGWCRVAIAAPYRPMPSDASPSIAKLLLRRAA